MWIRFFCFLFFFPVPGLAQSTQVQGMLITADSLTRDIEKELLDLKGNVQIVRDQEHISADAAKLFLRTKRIELYGRVKMISPLHTVGGELVHLDYETNTGVIYNGYVQSGPVIFEGRVLQKISSKEYFVSEGEYTTCDNCPASWSFSGRKVRAELGGYAFIKNSVLRFGGVPVLWLPYLVVPLKSERQTGLLTPEFEQSSEGGFAISQPFFWAINRSQDATLTLKHYEKRGLKYLANYRYLLDEYSWGELDVAQISDSVFKDSDRFIGFRWPEQRGKSFDRWRLKFNQQLELPQGYTHRFQLNRVSDLQYPRDFPLETKNYGDAALENRMSLARNNDDLHWRIEAFYFENMQSTDPLASNEDSVHRLPELVLSKPLTPLGSLGLAYDYRFSYTNFHRSGKSYDDLKAPSYVKDKKISGIPEAQGCSGIFGCKVPSDGKYDPYQDQLRTGQRFMFEPTLQFPIQIRDGVDLQPKVLYQESKYLFDVGPSSERELSRRLVKTEVALATTLSRVYGDMSDPLSDRVLHESKPIVTYSRIPWIYQKNHPFLSLDAEKEIPINPEAKINNDTLITQNGFQFDTEDRITGLNTVRFEIANRWVQKRWTDLISSYREIANLRVWRDYDINKADRGDSKVDPWSPYEASGSIAFDQLELTGKLTYFPNQKLTNTNSKIILRNDLGQFFSLDLKREYSVSDFAEVDSRTRTEEYTLGSGFTSRYWNLMGKIVYDGNWANNGGGSKRQVKSWAYISQFKPPGNCWFITLIHDQVLAGETNIRLNFEFSFDGQPRKPILATALDSLGK